MGRFATTFNSIEKRKLGFEKINKNLDNFEFHTPYTTGFTPLTSISRTQNSRNLTEKFVSNQSIPIREVFEAFL